MKLTALWRHPIKAHGRERLETATLRAGRCFPYDREWAVAHEAARTDGSAWAPCANFSRGAKAASLMAIDCSLDEASETLTLRHPARPDLTVKPDVDGQNLIDWVKPLMPEDRAQSNRIVRVPGRGMTDSAWPSISILNLASHRAVESQLGQSLDPIRWRANLWIDDVAPWSETHWIGKILTVGDAKLRIRERITRCLATTANPATGERDADILGALEAFGHQEMGLYGEVIEGGQISAGDTMTLE